MKSTLAIMITMAFCLGCKKSNLDTRVLAPGTKCTIYAGIFNPGDKQPAQPVVVTGLYNPGDNSAFIYNVTDSNGVAWIIPDSDLRPVN